ncbi:MAG: hypothetical protein EZS28_046091, partial [Streblomastix strix]
MKNKHIRNGSPPEADNAEYHEKYHLPSYDSDSEESEDSMEDEIEKLIKLMRGKVSKEKKNSEYSKLRMLGMTFDLSSHELEQRLCECERKRNSKKNRPEIGQILYGKGKSTLEKSIRRTKGWRTCMDITKQKIQQMIEARDTALMKPNEEFVNYVNDDLAIWLRHGLGEHCQYEDERLMLWCVALPVVARGAISRWSGGDNFVYDV